MKEINLTDVQLKTIIISLSFVDIEEVFEHDVEIIDFKPSASDGDSFGIQCQYYLTKNGIKYEYLLFIGYYSISRQNNPQSIAVWRIVYGNKLPEIIGNVGYVTDRLRAYGVWDVKDSEPNVIPYYQLEVLIENEWTAVKEMRRDGKNVYVIYDSTEQLSYEEATLRYNNALFKYHGFEFRVNQI